MGRARSSSNITSLSQLQVANDATRRRKQTLSNDDQTVSNCDCLDSSYKLSSKKPNVWVFGDSIAQKTIGYFSTVEDLIGDQVELIYGGGGFDPASAGGCGSSFGAVACMPTWIGKHTEYDAITFNWGLHDIAPDMYTKVENNEYASNLMKMYKIMKKHLKKSGTIVWQSTTPVPPN